MSLPVAPDHTPASLRSDISCTLFLNDPDEYEGGELIIADTYGEHEIKLPAGDLIIYPSTSLHRVAPVTRGMRIASFFGCKAWCVKPHTAINYLSWTQRYNH